MRKRSLPALRLDFRTGLPAYLQITHQIKRHISSGKLRPGDQLPTVRWLALQLGVNFNTVARAYRLMNQAGVVSAQRGRGTYVMRKAAGSAGKRSRALTILDALATHYVAEARRHHFSEAQIAAMVARRLESSPAALRALGENDG
jgi:GntR family transcriptional regulator